MGTSNNETFVSICSDIFSLVIKLRTTNNYGNPSQLLKKVKELFGIFDIRSRSVSDLNTDDIYKAKYALAALIDETILSSNWDGRDFWRGQSLQLEFFNENIAGAEFFAKLDNIRTQGYQKCTLLEIYYYCLFLGFEGKYKFEGIEKLNALKNTLGEEIRRFKKEIPSNLSPGWEPPPEFIKKIKSEIPIWVFSAGILSISFIFYFIFQFLISKETANLTLALKELVAGGIK